MCFNDRIKCFMTDPQGCSRHTRPRGRATRANRSAYMVHRWREGGVDTWQAMRVHTDAPVVPRDSVEACKRWDHGLMGPSKSIGAVTQRRYMALAFILAKSSFFLSLGLNPLNLKFSIRRGEAWCIESIVPRRSREHGVHRITIKTHASNHILSNVFDD